MKNRLLALLYYSLFWLLFFFMARLFFVLTHFNEASGSGFINVLLTFWHGLKLDISSTGYIFLIPVLLMIPGVTLTGNWFRIFMKWYTWVIIIISASIVVSDTLLYKYWGFRMDYTPLLYLKTPKEAMASVTLLQASGVLLGITAISLSFIYLYNKHIDRLFGNFDRIRPSFPAILFFMILWGALIIPVRGGIGVAPINAGTVYFSDDMFVNHTAINVVWNLGSSVFNKKPASNPYSFFDLVEAKETAASLSGKSDNSLKLLNHPMPNILFIVLESFGNNFVGPLGGDSLTTPNLNRYADEGILFANFYASGNRTDKAMPAILSGYPAQPAVSIMKEPKKTQSLPGIVKKISELGYHTAFWYGGEINFANFHSFVIHSGFRQIITMDNFGPRAEKANWGVHDHIVFETLRDSMKSVKEPFLKVVLTLSSHEPFDIPMDPVFEGKDDLTKFRNSLFYADRSVGMFLNWAKNTEWWKNTLVVIVADHCRKNSDDHVYDEDIFRIPMLWLGGALDTTGIRIEKIGSQVDIPLTILHQLGLHDNYPFGKDLLDPASSSYAFYVFNDGFGFITDTSKYIYDHKSGEAVFKEGNDPESAGRYGKAILQVLYQDYMNR